MEASLDSQAWAPVWVRTVPRASVPAAFRALFPSPPARRWPRVGEVALVRETLARSEARRLGVRWIRPQSAPPPRARGVRAREALARVRVRVLRWQPAGTPRARPVPQWSWRIVASVARTGSTRARRSLAAPRHGPE